MIEYKGDITKKDSEEEAIILKELNNILNSLQDISLDNWMAYKFGIAAPLFRTNINIDPEGPIGEVLKKYNTESDDDRRNIYRFQCYAINSVIMQISRIFVYEDKWNIVIDIESDKAYKNKYLEDLQIKLNNNIDKIPKNIYL